VTKHYNDACMEQAAATAKCIYLALYSRPFTGLAKFYGAQDCCTGYNGITSLVAYISGVIKIVPLTFSIYFW